MEYRRLLLPAVGSLAVALSSSSATADKAADPAIAAESPKTSRESGTLSCARVTHTLVPGAFVSADDLTPAVCMSAAPKPAFRYDQPSHSIRAARSLAAGEIVTAVRSSMLPAIAPGQAFLISARVGPVTVERLVRAIQPCRAGQKVFVRGETSTVFAVDCPAVHS